MYMNDFLTLAAARESCRNYDATRPVEAEKLEKCIQAAQLAPSARNTQPWFYTVVTNPEQRDIVSESVQMGGKGINKFASQVPAFVLCQRLPIKARPEEEAAAGRSLDFSQIDLGISVAHLCLEATDLGLSTCIMGWLDEARLRKELNLSDADLRLVIGVGYAATEELRPKKRKNMDEICK